MLLNIKGSVQYWFVWLPISTKITVFLHVLHVCIIYGLTFHDPKLAKTWSRIRIVLIQICNATGSVMMSYEALKPHLVNK